ncbi:putative 1-aminocyclopropane-1-carboxylate oxidase [Frankliniella fusca]|uniref:1-aminocyclopropane-1-carboxylate oxidase n=1 Tax=Frankliniella fusca TaxID=407009 RepID=A0AAE1GWV5_9NEOP|nr:putative 1-aminocyclopropane-1-carboxylate oxidase [Frankliniella fusca]
MAHTLKATYHNKCRAQYIKRVKSQSASCKTFSVSDRGQIHGLALAGLVANMKTIRQYSEEPPVFKMAALAREYADRLSELGQPCDVHSTRLRERLLQECPELEHVGTQGQDILIAFKKDIDFSIRSDVRHFDSEGFHLAQAAEIVREDMFSLPPTDWTNMSKESQLSCVPTSLLTLLKMIMNGPGARAAESDDQVLLTICQLISFHSAKRGRKGLIKRHDQSRENPLVRYVAAKLYGETRKKDLVDIAYRLGLSCSYDRFQTVLTDMANDACDFYHNECVVCPMPLRGSLFTTAQVDNIDHNLSSTTAKGSFHGTAISMIQHPTPENRGEARNALSSDSLQRRRKVRDLPLSYAVVEQKGLPEMKNLTCSPSQNSKVLSFLHSPLDGEKEWLEGSTKDDTCVRWAAHHAKFDDTSEKCKATIAVLPVFYEVAHTSDMMLHCMNIVKSAVNHINKEQTPVIVADQALYCILKQIQFRFPDTHGEGQFCILMGGLHIEMAFLRALGHWLDGSGWVHTLVEAEVTTTGRAESMLTVSHVARTRYCHEVTAATLYSLQRKAYDSFMGDTDDPATFEQWREEKCKSTPQFKYWDLTLRLQLILLQFVRAERTANFQLYIESLSMMAPWFFALDHTNYARWLPIHIKDLVMLKESNPNLHREFQKGHFVARKTCNLFSALALDQAHEQVNAQLKGDGGMVGLTENVEALRKFMLSGPELSQMVVAFEEGLLSEAKNIINHHSDTKSAQKTFLKDKKSLEGVFCELGNPFLEESADLYNLDLKTVAHDSVKDTEMHIEERALEHYETYVSDRLESNRVPIGETIKQKKYPLFSSSLKKGNSISAQKSQLQTYKNDCSLFSRLYIATSANRPGDLSDFFEHENQAYPPSISVMGQLRTSDAKSDLVKFLTTLHPNSTTAAAPFVHSKVLDGAAIVHMLKPGTSSTFKDYIEKVFKNYLNREISTVTRLDIVFDRYKDDSLKNCTRDKRGEGTKVKISLTAKVPKGWEKFLRNSANKTALFNLLAESISDLATNGKQLYATKEEEVVSAPPHLENSSLSPCNHEEADTRLFVHVANAVQNGNTKVMIRTCDTDVLVLAISCLPKIPELEELWLHFGMGKHAKFIAVHEISNALGPEKSQTIIGFHAVTGCDTVSYFRGIGKLTAINAWFKHPNATTAFKALQTGDVLEAMEHLESFIVTMYTRSGICSTVNECRRILFTKHSRNTENIPPTKDALHQHALRASLQAQIWDQAVQALQDPPNPAQFGWVKEGDLWNPVWRTIPVASEACQSLVRCNCKKGCMPNRCKCRLNNMPTCCEFCGCNCDEAQPTETAATA